MKHHKKNPGNGLHAPASRRMANQQAPPAAPMRVKPTAAGDSENHPAEDPRFRSHHQNENQARFSRTSQQRPYQGNVAERMVQRDAWGPDAAYEVNDVNQLKNDEPLEDEARTLDRIRTERSRLLDDE